MRKANGKPIPKFVYKKTATAVYSTLTFGPPKKKKVHEDEQWVKDLNLFKKDTAETIAYRKQVLDDHQETTEELLEMLEDIDDVQDDVSSLCKEMTEQHMKLYYVVKSEDEMIADANRNVDPEEVARLKQDAVDRLKESRYKAIQIVMKARQDKIDAEAARLRKLEK